MDAHRLDRIFKPKWNLKRIVAQTTTDNARMISVFKKRGFQIQIGTDSTVDVAKVLDPT